jgi:hypothetical protein
MLVRTCASIDEAEIRRLRDDMFGIGCATGLLFDSERCAILRDTFQSMTPDSIVAAEGSVRTADVLANSGTGSLDARVGRWLEMVSANWYAALSGQLAAAAPFISDIVPAVSGSIVQASPAAAGRGQ